MDQQKTGVFLKELRREKGLSQEQFAEIMSVSNRTVSRWETGRNMPDLGILVEIAKYYDVDLREILDGERKSGKMNRELEETVRKVADYSNEEKSKLTKRMHLLFIVGNAAFLTYLVLLFTDTVDTFTNGLAGGLCLGFSSGTLIVGLIMTSRYASKIRAFKMNLLHKLFPRWCCT